MRVLGIVPARGGSKGIPNKNIVPLAGKPLLAYTAEAALAAKRLTRAVLSTDDERIAEVGRKYGLEVPFMRLAELARDETPTVPVLQDVVRRLEASGERFDAICALQPTCPLRSANQIDACIDLFEQSGADSALTILEVPAKYNPEWVYVGEPSVQLQLASKKSEPPPRRQELPRAYHREGSVYVARRDVLMQGNSMYGSRTVGLLVDRLTSVNIDEPADLVRADEILRMLRTNETG